MIGGHFPAETSQQLRMLAVEEDTTVQALLEEAIADLLTKKAGRRFAGDPQALAGARDYRGAAGLAFVLLTLGGAGGDLWPFSHVRAGSAGAGKFKTGRDFGPRIAVAPTPALALFVSILCTWQGRYAARTGRKPAILGRRTPKRSLCGFMH
jgi:hypothetical protein